jgi:hypothetical protein
MAGLQTKRITQNVSAAELTVAALEVLLHFVPFDNRDTKSEIIVSCAPASSNGVRPCLPGPARQFVAVGLDGPWRKGRRPGRRHVADGLMKMAERRWIMVDAESRVVTPA